MSRGGAPGFLDPAVLARIGDLTLVARTVVEGFMHGLHRAPRLGHSTDFAEHRPYQPGDDIRKIDWRVYGRTDRYYIKEFEADTNASVVFAVDVSGSMAFGSRGVTKWQYARMLAGSLAWFSQHQGDRVGLVLYGDSIREYVPPSTRHLSLLLHTLQRAEPSGAAAGAEAIGAITALLGRTGITVFLSDWYVDPGVVKEALGQVRVRGHDVIAFHLADPAEKTLPYDEAASFEDLETGDRLSVVPSAQRERYQSLVAAHHQALADQLAGSGVDYHAIDTSAALDLALYEYLRQREMLGRVR
jgi:uncharacterized protein (DUF58 family)